MKMNILSTMATTSTSRALYHRHLFGVEEILPLVHRVIICGDEVMHDCEVRKLSAPPSPFANCTQPPMPLG